MSMSTSSVPAFGQWGYPIQGLGSYGGAEEKKPSSIRLISDHAPPPKKQKGCKGKFYDSEQLTK